MKQEQFKELADSIRDANIKDCLADECTCVTFEGHSANLRLANELSSSKLSREIIERVRLEKKLETITKALLEEITAFRSERLKLENEIILLKNNNKKLRELWKPDNALGYLYQVTLAARLLKNGNIISFNSGNLADYLFRFVENARRVLDETREK